MLIGLPTPNPGRDPGPIACADKCCRSVEAGCPTRQARSKPASLSLGSAVPAMGSALSSADGRYCIDYFRARALFTDVVEGLKADGWTDYLLEDSRDPRKEYEWSSWAREGDIYFVDTGLKTVKQNGVGVVLPPAPSFTHSTPVSFCACASDKRQCPCRRAV